MSEGRVVIWVGPEWLEKVMGAMSRSKKIREGSQGNLSELGMGRCGVQFLRFLTQARLRNLRTLELPAPRVEGLESAISPWL